MSPDLDTLYYGDCLDWMQHWDDQSIDLIYLDPPFNSKAQYNVLFGKSGGIDAQYRAFNDTWVWDDAAANRLDAIAHPAHRAILGLHTMLGECGMLGYLTYMAERLAEMHRLMKPTGSIYLHCDPTASHYLKALMDEIIVKQGGGDSGMKSFGIIGQEGRAKIIFPRNTMSFCFMEKVQIHVSMF